MFLLWITFILYDSAPVRRARGLPERFVEEENDVNHMLQLSHSPELNLIEHLLGNLERRGRRRSPPHSSKPQLRS